MFFFTQYITIIINMVTTNTMLTASNFLNPHNYQKSTIIRTVVLALLALSSPFFVTMAEGQVTTVAPQQDYITTIGGQQVDMTTTDTDDIGTIFVTGMPDVGPTQFPTTPPPPIIPGCERLLTYDSTKFGTDDAPTCFCDEEFEDTLTVSCLFGSTLAGLNETLNLVRKAGWTKPIRQLYTTKLHIQDQHINRGFFSGLAIQQLHLENCKGVFYMDDGALDGLEETLVSVKINQCYLGPSTMPIMFKGHRLMKDLNMHRCGILYEIGSDAFEGLTALETLDLSRNRIPSLEPGAFESLVNLKYLILDNNYLNETIWPELNRLDELRNFTMRSNRVKEFPPGALSNLGNLKFADFSENKFTYLQSGSLAGLGNVTFLKLQVNGINQTDQDCLQDLLSVETLYLDGNFLTEENLDILNNLPNLRVLGLRHNNFATIPDDSFVRLPDLTRLELGHNYVFENLNPQSFRGLTSLEVLGLQSSSLTHLNRSLDVAVLPSLRELDFSGHSLKRMPKLFFQGATQLEVIQLYRGSFETLRHPHTFEILPNLKLLDISENPFYCDNKMVKFVNWFQSKLEDFQEGRTQFQFIDVDATYCEDPEKHHLSLFQFLNTSDMTQRVYKNLTSSEEVNEFFGWTDSAEATTFAPGNAVDLPDMKVYRDGSENKSSPASAAIIGILIAMVLITALVVMVVLVRHVRKNRKSEQIRTLNTNSNGALVDSAESTKSSNLYLGGYDSNNGFDGISGGDSSSGANLVGVTSHKSINQHDSSNSSCSNNNSNTIKDFNNTSLKEVIVGNGNSSSEGVTLPPPSYESNKGKGRLDSSAGYETVTLED